MTERQRSRPGRARSAGRACQAAALRLGRCPGLARWVERRRPRRSRSPAHLATFHLDRLAAGRTVGWLGIAASAAESAQAPVVRRGCTGAPTGRSASRCRIAVTAVSRELFAAALERLGDAVRYRARCRRQHASWASSWARQVRRGSACHAADCRAEGERLRACDRPRPEQSTFATARSML